MEGLHWNDTTNRQPHSCGYQGGMPGVQCAKYDHRPYRYRGRLKPLFFSLAMQCRPLASWSVGVWLLRIPNLLKSFAVKEAQKASRSGFLPGGDPIQFGDCFLPRFLGLQEKADAKHTVEKPCQYRETFPRQLL